MEDSANSEGGLRERKRRETRHAVTASARALTASKGLNGFTVEEVCESVGISRRTFFNYFPSKEDAVLGHHDDEHSNALLADFARKGGQPGSISETLLADLVHLMLDIWAAKVDSEAVAEIRQLMAAIKKEPQLLAKIVGLSAERDATFRTLLGEREGVPADHPVVVMAVSAVGSMAHHAHQAYFSETNTRPFPEILLEDAHALQALFSQHLPSLPEGSS